MDPDLLLDDAALDAAVGALALRNQHHFEAMTDPERAQAVETWRELATDVLVAVRARIASGERGGPPAAHGGRAVLVFEDAGDEDVSVHAAFHPELEEIAPGEVAGSPAQLTALALLEQLSPEPGDEQP